MLEICINNRLINFLNKNIILNNIQYGFQKTFSTADSMEDTMDYVYSLDKGEKRVCIFLGLAKAFDHNILLNKLEILNIKSTVLNLITLSF